ncbi:MAG: hypothetical protein ACFFD4_20640 [Candidatus Odinarchaeota archaeon]
MESDETDEKAKLSAMLDEIRVKFRLMEVDAEILDLILEEELANNSAGNTAGKKDRAGKTKLEKKLKKLQTGHSSNE